MQVRFTLLLYRSGFYIGRYISLESKIANNKDLYYNALYDSQRNWHEENDDSTPFIKYLLGTILSAYKDFEDRVELIQDKLTAFEIAGKATSRTYDIYHTDSLRIAYIGFYRKWCSTRF